MTAARPIARTGGRKDWVDFAKGVAIVLVVLYHCTLFLRSIDVEVAGIGRVKTLLEMVPMPVFLFIAGLFHLRVLDWTLRDTWRRRLLPYLYLYVLWSVLRFLFYAVVPNVRGDGAGVSASDPRALLTVLVWPISSYWFILALVVFTLVLQAVRAWPRWVPLALATGLSLLFGTGAVTVLNVGWDRMGEYLVFFLVGAFASRRLFDAIAAASGRVVVASGAVYAGLGVVTAAVPGAAHVPGVVLLGEAAAIVFVATASVRLARLPALRWVSGLGARSLQIYLLHVFVIAALAAVIRLLPAVQALPGRGLPLMAAMTAATLLLSLLLNRLLGRFSWLFVPPRRLQQSRLAGGAPAQRRGAVRP